jgi:hypothetical protein
LFFAADFETIFSLWFFHCCCRHFLLTNFLVPTPACLSKGYFGKWSDSSGLRLPFVKIGYLLSAISKPMLGMLTLKWWIFLSRTTDRLGKGIRTAARDTLLSQEATPATAIGFYTSCQAYARWASVPLPACCGAVMAAS